MSCLISDENIHVDKRTEKSLFSYILLTNSYQFFVASLKQSLFDIIIYNLLKKVAFLTFEQ